MPPTPQSLRAFLGSLPSTSTMGRAPHFHSREGTSVTLLLTDENIEAERREAGRSLTRTGGEFALEKVNGSNKPTEGCKAGAELRVVCKVNCVPHPSNSRQNPGAVPRSAQPAHRAHGCRRAHRCAWGWGLHPAERSGTWATPLCIPQALSSGGSDIAAPSPASWFVHPPRDAVAPP